MSNLKKKPTAKTTAKTATKTARKKSVAKPKPTATSKRSPAKKKVVAPRKAGQLVEDQRKKRLKVYRTNFKAPTAQFRGEDLGAYKIDILAFEKEVGGERGFVLATNGMSDHRPPRPDPKEAYPLTELLWYTRDVTDEKVKFLYWLSTQPFETGKPMQFGELLAAPKPPISGCPNQHVTLLKPIVLGEKLMFTGLALMAGYFELLVVHLLSSQEFNHMKKSDKRFNDFLDLLDKNRYPLFLDPKRPSYL